MAQPPAQLVDAYLHEIAKGYSVDWTPPGFDDDDGEGGAKLTDPDLVWSISIWPN